MLSLPLLLLLLVLVFVYIHCAPKSSYFGRFVIAQHKNKYRDTPSWSIWTALCQSKTRIWNDEALIAERLDQSKTYRVSRCCVHSTAILNAEQWVINTLSVLCCVYYIHGVWFSALCAQTVHMAKRLEFIIIYYCSLIRLYLPLLLLHTVAHIHMCTGSFIHSLNKLLK